jgi:hypothetical protein
MAGTGIRSFAKLRSQMPRIATTAITPWQTALKWTVVARNTCGQVRPVAICSQIDTSVCGNPQYGYYIRGNSGSIKRQGLPQSAVHI